MPATTLTEQALDIQLVRQKDRILSLINRDPVAAMKALAIVCELWREAGYEYKTREILARMVTDPDKQLARLYADL